jgi:hypothetical protein
LLKKFRHVVVAEDYMNFPPYSLLREVAREGLIGDLRAAILYNIGYAYHGLALIRSFTGFRSVLRSWRDSLGTYTNTVNYRFGNGFRACVIGPYRPQRNGGIVVEGSRGVITEVAGDQIIGDPKHRPIFTLNKIHENNLICGFSVDDGTKRLAQINTPEVALMEKMDFQDKSEHNLLRGCGLIAVFRSLVEAKNVNLTYGYKNALYDSLIGALANRGLLPFDPLVLVRSNMMLCMRALSKII